MDTSSFFLVPTSGVDAEILVRPHASKGVDTAPHTVGGLEDAHAGPVHLVGLDQAHRGVQPARPCAHNCNFAFRRMFGSGGEDRERGWTVRGRDARIGDAP